MAHLEIQRREREGIAILDLNGRLSWARVAPCCGRKSPTRWRAA